MDDCTHPIKFGGLCAACGRDVSKEGEDDTQDASKANIRMSHHHAALTVTRNEAERIHEENTQALLKGRKLSLIVDLDQTVVHATVDPTVAEWLEDPSNPNYEALQHVGKFKLALDGSPVLAASSSAKKKGKQKATEQDEEEDDGGCWYYVKQRPGLQSFLEAASLKYEMHVYTMGTRSYAEEVCKIIDPETKYFGSRILTRDESGSMTQKSLERLFPCETSMVVVIDDRGDVWDWSPNLLKVVPYEFFVGIGDINAAFLPKQANYASAEIKKETSPSTSDTTSTASTSESTDQAHTVPSTSEATQATSATLSSQIAERPLQKRQAEATAKQHEHAEDHKAAEPMDEDAKGEPDDEENVAVLKDDDTELDRLLNLLGEVHRQFYVKMDRGRSADVKSIISTIKLAVLKNVNILFSSVIPLGVDQTKSEIWRLAESFGAICWTQLNKHVTHLVTGKEGTAKVSAAQDRKDITIVWTAWLVDSMAVWQRLDEQKYLISGPTSEKPILDDRDHLVDEDHLSEESEVDVAVDIEDADIDWGTADAELDAYLEQSDGDGDDSSAASTPRLKRSRSATPHSGEESGNESPGSPLLKRQRVAKARKSNLKVSFAAATSSAPPSAADSPMPEDASDDDLDDMANTLSAGLAQ